MTVLKDLIVIEGTDKLGRKTVTVKDGYKIGNSICLPEDNYSPFVGFCIAFTNMVMGDKELLKEKLKNSMRNWIKHDGKNFPAKLHPKDEIAVITKMNNHIYQDFAEKMTWNADINSILYYRIIKDHNGYTYVYDKKDLPKDTTKQYIFFGTSTSGSVHKEGPCTIDFMHGRRKYINITKYKEVIEKSAVTFVKDYQYEQPSNTIGKRIRYWTLGGPCSGVITSYPSRLHWYNHPQHPSRITAYRIL